VGGDCPGCGHERESSPRFQTIGVHETENHSDFQRVPDDLTLAEAAGILNRQTVVADNR
jgi:hypothetical protein